MLPDNECQVRAEASPPKANDGQDTESSQANRQPKGSWRAGRRKSERMVFETKDFQNQAQWALVAIPAPIYFVWRQSKLRLPNFTKICGA